MLFKRTPWEIRISVKQTDQFIWLFEVKDLGGGFDRKELDKLYRRIESGYRSYIDAIEVDVSRKGIGLFNTIVRIMDTYREQAFYEIQSNEPLGAIVRIGAKRIGSNKLVPSA